jgi:PhnB protein
MAEMNAIERLDELVESLLTGRDAARPVVDGDLATLAAVAADLRGLPDSAFRSRLKSRLVPGQEKKMTTTAITPREGLHTITPYFVVSAGDPFIEFLKQAFGGELQARYPRPDGSVMHAEVNIGGTLVELGQANEQYKAITMGIHLYVQDVDRVYEQALRAGATSLHPLTNQPYGDREGSVRDPFGNHWYIATHQGADWKPEGFQNVNLFLHPRGAKNLIDFLQRAFGADEMDRTLAPDGSVLHASLRLGDAVIEMGEAHGEWTPMPGNIHFFVADSDEVYERAMNAGATSVFPVKDQPYGERSGCVTDPTGNTWFIATPK